MAAATLQNCMESRYESNEWSRRDNPNRAFWIWMLLVAWLFCAGAHAQSAPNYQGLWWAAPAGVESGWGINFAHQGDQVFATWYTYDTSGRAWWLSMLAPRATPTGNVYAGTIYVDHGPPFNNFVGAGVPTAVGNGTLTFTDANNGTFAYVVNGVTQTKAITRFDLGTGPPPTCAYNATTPNLAAATNYQDLWWVANGAESGWGVNFAHQGDSVYATWYTYDLDGAPLWVSALAPRQGTSNVYSGALYRTSGPRFDQYDPTQIQTSNVGTATFTFTDGNHATFAYSTNGTGGLPAVTQTKQLTRFLFAANGGTVCQSLPDPQYRASDLSPFAPGCEGSAGPRHALRERRSRAVRRGQPAESVESDRRLAAGPLVGRRRQGIADRHVVRRRAHLDALDGRVLALHRRQRGQRRRFRARVRSVGRDRCRRHRLPDRESRSTAMTFAPGSSGAVLASRSTRRRAHLERAGHADRRRRASISTTRTRSPPTRRSRGYAYAVWDRLRAAGHGPTYFSRTIDGGVTWEPARAIYDPGGNNQTINNQIVVLTDGTLVTFFTRLDVLANAARTATLAVIRSTDKGVDVVGADRPCRACSRSARAIPRPARRCATARTSARSPRDRVACWSPSGRTRASPAAFATASRCRARPTAASRGRLRCRSIAIRRWPRSSRVWRSAATGRSASPTSTFAAIRRIRRRCSTDYWIARSSDGVTWRESRVAGPFDLANAPNAEGLFLGDYQAIVGIGTEFVPFYAAVNSGDAGNRTDIFASLVTSAGTAANAAAGRAKASSDAEGAYRAETASTMPVTPELARRITDSVARTILRRVPGWLPPGMSGLPEH